VRLWTWREEEENSSSPGCAPGWQDACRRTAADGLLVKPVRLWVGTVLCYPFCQGHPFCIRLEYGKAALKALESGEGDGGGVASWTSAVSLCIICSGLVPYLFSKFCCMPATCVYFVWALCILRGPVFRNMAASTCSASVEAAILRTTITCYWRRPGTKTGK